MEDAARVLGLQESHICWVPQRANAHSREFATNDCISSFSSWSPQLLPELNVRAAFLDVQLDVKRSGCVGRRAGEECGGDSAYGRHSCGPRNGRRVYNRKIVIDVIPDYSTPNWAWI